jgi:hypothetical protein
MEESLNVLTDLLNFLHVISFIDKVLISQSEFSESLTSMDHPNIDLSYRKLDYFIVFKSYFFRRI